MTGSSRVGRIQSAYVGLRPWTRLECARLLQEAEEQSGNRFRPAAGWRRRSRAGEEFAAETHRLDGSPNQGVSLDSVYARTTSIAGTPLRDGYHFGQSIVNDYGRPYAAGFNAIAGFTAHAEAGPLSVSVQEEYQRAPAVSFRAALGARSHGWGGLDAATQKWSGRDKPHAARAGRGGVDFQRDSIFLRPAEPMAWPRTCRAFSVQQ